MNAESGHQANSANGKLRGLNDGVIAKDAEFEAAAAEIDDATRLGFRTERGDDRFPAKARFFFGADNFEGNPGGFLNGADELFAILGFAGGAGGDGAIFGDADARP